MLQLWERKANVPIQMKSVAESQIRTCGEKGQWEIKGFSQWVREVKRKPFTSVFRGVDGGRTNK